MGKSCVRFRKLEDLSLDVIGEAIRKVSARGFVEYYISVIKIARRRPAADRTAKPSSSTEKQRATKVSSAKRRK